MRTSHTHTSIAFISYQLLAVSCSSVPINEFSNYYVNCFLTWLPNDLNLYELSRSLHVSKSYEFYLSKIGVKETLSVFQDLFAASLGHHERRKRDYRNALCFQRNAFISVDPSFL